MKWQTLILFLVLLLIPFSKVLSQQNESIIKRENDSTLYQSPPLEIKPSPVDKVVYDQWIKDNNRKFGEDPDSGPGVSLKVIVVFTVDNEGNVLTPKIWRGIGYGFDEEAWRLIKENPNKWNPAMVEGKPVNRRVYYQIDFLNNENKIM